MRYDEVIENLLERVSALEGATPKPAGSADDVEALAARVTVLEDRVPELPAGTDAPAESQKAGGTVDQVQACAEEGWDD
jgi:hypothetical protein